MMWELKYQDALEEGRAEGWTEVMVSHLRNLMKNTGWPLEQAMVALGISKAEQPMLIRLLKEDETLS